jgi:hypothetical protein
MLLGIPTEPVSRNAMVKIVRVARPLRKASANADAFGANTPAFSSPGPPPHRPLPSGAAHSAATICTLVATLTAFQD